MDGFNVPMLSESGYSNNSNNPLQTHHHKDQMLSAGSAPATPYIYELHNKIEGGSSGNGRKSDYATFTNCIQQSALLDHRAGDASIDAVSLSGLCDLKIPSPSATTTDTNFKNISLINIEANHVLVPSKPSTGDLLTDASMEPNFANILYTKENITIDPKTVPSCLPAQVLTHYLPLKANTEAASKFEKVTLASTRGGATTIPATVTVASYEVVNPVVTHTSNNNGQKTQRNIVQILNNQITQHATILRADQVAVSDYLSGGGSSVTSFSTVLTPTASRAQDSNKNRNELSSSAENQITTTTSTITNTATASKIITNNIINNVSASASAIGSANSSNNTGNITITANNNHNAPGLTSTTATSTAITITRSRATVLQHVEDVTASSSSRTGAVIVSTIPPTEVSSNSNNSSSGMSPSSGAAKDIEQHKQQMNSSNLSTECDSQSSSDELDDLEISDSFGYQDNASSHSQQSVSGGGGSNGGGGGGSSANVVLLNGGNGNSSGGYMTLLPPATSSGHLGATSGGTSASSGPSGEVIDFKHLFEELCPVCGDKVSGYHYGLLTCESCKGFFKRTVQNKKVYTCVAERSCHIDKTQRKRCPFCRFQKCLEVGMKLEAVRADRMRGGRNKFGPMYKRDRARKLQVMRQRQLALQALRTSIGSVDMKPSPLSPGYQQAYPNMNIKQEIQIPQVSSLTQSPDSSPSPIAIALGQVNTSTGVISTPMNGGSGNGGGGGGGGGGGHGSGGGANNSNSSNTSDGINRGGGNGNCHDTGTGSLQNATESKMCFDSGTHPSSTADSIIEPLRVSPMIRDFVQSIDDREWQTQLFALLQKQTYNQVEVDLFELMCKVLDQNLFSQVDWARNTVFFKDLKVDDQMKLLQHSWSDMLVLDHLHQRIHNGLPDETQLNNGQVFNLLWLGLLGVPQLSDYFNELQNRLQDLKFDMGDYVCMKFLILLNPDVRGIINKKTVLEGQDNVQAALLDYTLTCYPSVTDKFRRLLSILPDIHAMAERGEEHLYSKHCAGSAPTQTLLMEMLHAKRKV